MNTKLTIIASLVITALITACGGGEKKSETQETATEGGMESAEAVKTTYVVSPEASTITWAGEVAGVYGHEGLIKVKQGQIVAKGDSIVNGTVVIDMTTIMPTDSSSYSQEEGKRAIDLVNHLSTGDFFLVEEYPTATYEIKSQNGDQLIGDLTIRGITKEVPATIETVQTADGTLKGKATLVFDRQDFKVSWEHYMQDMVLSDDITVGLDIEAKS